MSALTETPVVRVLERLYTSAARTTSQFSPNRALWAYTTLLVAAVAQRC
jgi:hypothetical protein